MADGEKIRVLIVDDVAETRENVRKLLQFESDIEVVAAARTGLPDRECRLFVRVSIRGSVGI